MKKRSLFVATAMLLVAVLVATGATYAWFEADTGAASTTISMSVDEASKLQLSVDSINWTTSLDQDDLYATDSVWSDYTTTAADILKNDYQNDQYDEDGAMTLVDADLTTSRLVYFRSPVAGNVTIDATNNLFSGNGGAIVKCARVSFGDLVDENNIDNAQSYKAFAGADEGTDDLDVITSGDNAVVVVTMTKAADDFYYGYAYVNAWLEGTDEANCSAAKVALNNGQNITFACEFAQQ